MKRKSKDKQDMDTS